VRLRIPLAALVLFAFAVALSAVAWSGRLMPGDLYLAHRAQDTPHGATLEDLSRWVYAARFVVFAVAAALSLRARERTPTLVAVLALLALATNPVLKDFIDRPRPGAAQVVLREHPGGSGFPSGHAMASTLLFGYAAFVAMRTLPRAWAALLTLAAAAIVALVCWQRVYAGAHWPSDVAGGIAIAALLLLACVAISRAAWRVVR
jgi:membrane-associated phospholipid phosphatase